MKKFLMIGFLVLPSLTNANTPLVVEQNNPPPLEGSSVIIEQNHGEQILQPRKFKNIAELNHSLMLEYSAQDGKFENNIDEGIKGFGVGYSSSPHKNGFWGKFEHQQSNEYDGKSYEVSFGGHLNFLNINGFYGLGTLGFGVSVLDADGFDTSTYMTIPVGLEFGYTFTPSLSLYTGVGYKWAWDVSSTTTCKNGSQSNSAGSGTCSWNGGIDHYNYTIGDFDGLTYKAGVRYNF